MPATTMPDVGRTPAANDVDASDMRVVLKKIVGKLRTEISEIHDDLDRKYSQQLEEQNARVTELGRVVSENFSHFEQTCETMNTKFACVGAPAA